MNKQEENWELMTILSIPWSEANKVTDSADRKFLLDKCTQVKKILKEAEEENQKQMLAERSNIVTAANLTL
tara:strand:+ start:148 stop:360 length:213 start_codon:yes stop_codon:yes gene_type:complete